MSAIGNIFRRLREANTSIDYMKATDDELVDLVQTKKDRRAEEVLIRRYHNLIAHIGKKYFLHDGDSDDIQQEGLIGFSSAIRSYVPAKNKNFKQFAMMAAERNIKDAVSKSNARKNLALSKAANLSALETSHSKDDATMVRNMLDLADRNQRPEDKLINKESKQRILSYMNKNLTDHEKAVLTLYLKGLKYNDIATRLSVTRKSVDNAMQKIRSKMTVYRNTMKDSKLIRVIETILYNDGDIHRLNEAANILIESSFTSHGSIYTCIFGTYRKDGKEISREEYFKAKEVYDKESNPLKYNFEVDADDYQGYSKEDFHNLFDRCTDTIEAIVDKFKDTDYEDRGDYLDKIEDIKDVLLHVEDFLPDDAELEDRLNTVLDLASSADDQEYISPADRYAYED